MVQEWIEQLARRTRTSKTRWLHEDGEPTGKYSWDGVVGASLHYPDAGGAWQDVDLEAEEPDTDGFNIKLAKLPYFARIAEDSRRRIYLDRNDLSYWIEFGKPFPSMGAPSRYERWFHWNFTNARIGVRFDPDSIKFGFRLKNDHVPTSITIPFETEGITREGRLLYHDGKVVGALRRPIATGSNLDEFGMPVQKDCEVVFAPGKVTISLDPAGLEYPIDIDPTVDKQVGASADDGLRWGAAGFNTAFQNTRVGHRVADGVAHSFFRWTGVTLEGTITTSNVEVYGMGGAGAPENNLYGIDEDNPPAPTTFAEFDADPLTAAVVAWDVLWVNGAWNQSPSLNPIFQELVDTYVINNEAVMMQFRDDLGVGDNWNRCRMWDFVGNLHGAKLHVEYSVGNPWYAYAQQ